jgi:hypothetical protein
MRRIFSGPRVGRLLVILGVAGGTAACSSLLDVTNPATFGDESLNASALAPQLVTGVVARFQAMYDDLALNSAIITDEAVSGHNFPTVHDVDLRIVTKENSADVYERIEPARAAADSFAARLGRVYGDSATKSLGMARVQAYGSLTYTIMGEFLCPSPVDPNSDKIPVDSMFKLAVATGKKAIATATAYRAPAAANKVAADSILNLANLAVARAYLNLGDNTNAALYAGQVDTAFALRSYYDANNVSNVFSGSTTGTNRNLGVDVTFRNLDDARVRHSAVDSTGHDQTTRLFTPKTAPSFSGFNPATATGYTLSTSIRVASGLEAQYIKAEAEGPTVANIAFLEGRRTAFPSTTAATPTTVANYTANLRDQKRRDFFLDGHRLGDLRRYLKGGDNYFPTGAHPNRIRGGDYGTSTCFTPTDAEIVGNTNYKP